MNHHLEAIRVQHGYAREYIAYKLDQLQEEMIRKHNLTDLFLKGDSNEKDH